MWIGGLMNFAAMARMNAERGGAAVRIRPLITVAAIVTALFAVLPAARAAAVPGDLDPSFGRRGWVAAPFSSSGRPAMAGYVNGTGTPGKGTVIRYGKGMKEAARTVAAAFPGSKIRQDDQLGSII